MPIVFNTRRIRALNKYTRLPVVGAMSLSYRRNGDGGRPGACLVLAACWALTGAGLALWVFRAWMQPVPVFSPNDGPISADSNLDFWLGAALMAVPLAGLLVALAGCASGYMKRVQAPVRTSTAWTGAVIAAVFVDIAFLGTFAAPVPVFGMKLGQVNWGLVMLSAIFVMTGVAMIVVITMAGRSETAPPD